MPRPARSSEEIAEAKSQIIKQASALMNEHGYEEFSMRKLGARLGIAAKTIYNYFESKDELYLSIIIEGNNRLYEDCKRAYDAFSEPVEKLRAMCEAYIDFGLAQPHFYNLMFTFHVPRYRDFVGGPVEQTALKELLTANQVFDLFQQVALEATGLGSEAAEIARVQVIKFWCQIHGYIAGINSTILSYMHHDPESLRESVIQLLMKNILNEIEKTSTVL